MKTFIALGIVFLLILFLASACMSLPVFGSNAKGDRKAAIRTSPNFKNGRFVNREPTANFISKKEKDSISYQYNTFIKQIDSFEVDCSPSSVKADLNNIQGDGLVWMGHSSYFLQVDGIRFLIDPVFHAAAPVGFINKPFFTLYSEEDIPEIDYLVITHDHYDHLEYKTVKAIRERVKHVVCPLGVGAHLERWGYSPYQLVEMDWDESYKENTSNIQIYCLTQRHFSGRTLRQNRTLWASFMLQINGKTIFVSGDGGYGLHFAEIGRLFPNMDLAILENGQYNPQWAHIHTLPFQLSRVIADLGVKRVLTVHHSRYRESIHPIDEPSKVAVHIARTSNVTVLMPKIGVCVSPFEKE